MHHFFIGYVLLFGRNVKGNLGVVCCFVTTHSPDIVPNDYYLFPKLKNFLHGRNFESNDEAVMTVNHYLDSPDSDFFLEA